MRRRSFVSALTAVSATLGLRKLADGAESISVLHAGSLTTTFQKRLAPDFERRTGLHAEGEGRGSVANAKLIAAGVKTPDVFLSADVTVTRDLMQQNPGIVSWYASFATTRMVIAYSKTSAFGMHFAQAAEGKRHWYDVLRETGMRIGRTDPAIDPKGYRTLIVTKLAERLYRIPNLGSTLFVSDRNSDQTMTDEAILVRLEQGEIDAAFVYGLEATIRSLATIELDPRINLGDPHFASAYAKASVTIDGVIRTGEPIGYAYTIPTHAANARGGAAFLAYLVSPEGRAILDGAGLHSQTPRYFGDLNRVPTELRAPGLR